MDIPGFVLHCFYLLASINNPTINIWVQVFVGTYVPISLGYIPSCRIAGPYGDSMLNHLRTYQTFPKAVALFYTPISSV